MWQDSRYNSSKFYLRLGIVLQVYWEDKGYWFKIGTATSTRSYSEMDDAKMAAMFAAKDALEKMSSEVSRGIDMHITTALKADEKKME